MINLFEGILKNYPDLVTKLGKNDMFSEMVEKLAKADTSKLTKRDREIYEIFLRKAGVPEDVIKGGSKFGKMSLDNLPQNVQDAFKKYDTTG